VEFNRCRNPFGYFQACVFEPRDLLRIIRYQPDLLDPKVVKYLAALFIPAHIDRQPEPNIRFDRIGSAVLQVVCAYLIHYTDTAAFLLLINYDAAAFVRYRLLSRVQLPAAVAFYGTENIAGQTLRMDADEDRFGTCHRAERQNYEFFVRCSRTIPDDPERSEFRRQRGRGDTLDARCRSVRTSVGICFFTNHIHIDHAE